MTYEIRLSEKEHTKFVNVMFKKLDKKKMNIKDLAAELNVSPKSVYNFIGDKTKKPSKFLAAKIADYLEMKPTDYKSKNSFFILIPFAVMLCIPFKVRAIPEQQTPTVTIEKQNIYDEVFGVDSGTDFVPGYYEPLVNEDIPLSAEHQLAIRKICEEKELSYPVVLALMEKESRFTADAVSKDKRNYGICQINPKFFECEDYFDVVQNVDAATDYLKKLLDEYENYEKALTKYNGQNAAKSKYSSWILERSNYYESII